MTTANASRAPATERDRELLAVTLEVLAETGYDRLNLDLVTSRARASKATLYRRWPSKSALVVAAFVAAVDQDQAVPDTGSLRGDLLAVVERICAEMRYLSDLIIALLPEMRRSAELTEAFERDFALPRYRAMAEVLRRADERGELRDDVDPGLVWDILPGFLLYRTLTPGVVIGEDAPLVLVDRVLLPLIARD